MPSDMTAGDPGDCPSTQLRAWPDRIVIAPPGSGHEPGVGQRGGKYRVVAFVPQAAIEAFDEAILHRLAGRDAVPPQKAERRESDIRRRGSA